MTSDAPPSCETRPALTFLARWGFVIAALFIGVMAVLPNPPDLAGGVTSDKGNHFLAFIALTILHWAAYPSFNPFARIVALAALGAAIEAIQALPFVGRNAEFMDFVADVTATVAASLLMAVVYRKQTR